MKYKVISAVAVLLPLSTVAGAATLDYQVDAIFQSDSALELGRPDGSTCYSGDACYPAGFRLQGDGNQDRGGYWSGLNYGDRITAVFSFDPDNISAPSSCDIAGWSDCGDLINIRSFSDSDGKTDSEWFRDAPTSSLRFNLFDGYIRYEGEAGSYLMSGCSLTDPAHDGMPDGFCDYFGYMAEFSIVSTTIKGPTPIPLPASLPILASGLAGFGLWKWRWGWRKQRKPANGRARGNFA